MRLGVIAHFLDVALKCVQVEEQAGRLNVSLAHAGVGGDVVADLEMCELRSSRSLDFLPRQEFKHACV
jgi:hypothetical protein